MASCRAATCGVPPSRSDARGVRSFQFGVAERQRAPLLETAGPGNTMYPSEFEYQHPGGIYDKDKGDHRSACSWSLVVGLLVCAALLAAISYVSADRLGLLPTSTPAPDSSYCEADVATAEIEWSAHRKKWCCTNRGVCLPHVGVSSSSTTASTASSSSSSTASTSVAPFDCDQGFDNWVAGWSQDKKVWCCENAERGCPSDLPKSTTTPEPTTTPPKPYQCDKGLDSVDEWTMGKKAWCCQNEKKGCSTTEPPMPEPYVCTEGLHNWESGWSPGKKAWCCRHKNLGCPEETTTTSEPFDCDEGFSNWRSGWSDGKQRYCCQRHGKGCAPNAWQVGIGDGFAHMPNPYNCDVGTQDVESNWSLGKKAWCCRHQMKGCE